MSSDAKKRVLEEEDYVYSKRWDFSLKKVLKRHPDGCSNRTIANLLLVSERNVENIFELAVEKLRISMGANQ